MLPFSTLSLNAFGILVGTLSSGILSERLGKKNITIIGCILFSISFISLYFSADFKLFTAFYLLFGIAWGIIASNSVTVIKSYDEILSDTITGLSVYLNGYHGSCTDSVALNYPLISQINDHIMDALPLEMGINGPFSNKCATAQEFEPIPPHYSCTDQMSWCNEVGVDIVARAATLSERITAYLSESPDDPVVGEVASDQDRADLWRQRAAVGDADKFRERLEHLGLTPTDVPACLASPDVPATQLPLS